MTTSSRNWCFTYFFYVWEDIEFFLDLKCRGIIFQEEMCPNTQTPHLQGFIRFARAYTLSQVKAVFPIHMHHIHLESAVSPVDAVAYCRKGDTRFGECYEEGDLMFKQGESRELMAAYESIRDGTSYSKLVRSFPIQCIRHIRGLSFVKNVLDFERDAHFRTVTVLVLYGCSGAGKTRACYQLHPGLYKLDRSASGGNVWFDGYDGQTTLLIDDFYGWIPYGQLLNILDGYPLRLDVKGGHTRAAWTTVLLTSNVHPSEWYRTLHPSGCSPALRRRLHGCYCVRPDAAFDAICDFLSGDHTTGCYALGEFIPELSTSRFLTVGEIQRHRLVTIEGNMF
jgi:hypothetical protein